MRILFSVFLILMATPAFAADFVIDPKQSQISFEAVQDGKIVKGGFKNFAGRISFDPNNLKASKALVTINMKSSFAFDKDVDNTIKTDEWFNVAKFPEAVFEAKSFQLISGKTYVAKGDLTIKSIKLPIVISFNLNEFSAKSASITGSATVNRTKYGIGWADASSIKDAVKVNIAVKAIAN